MITPMTLPRTMLLKQHLNSAHEIWEAPIVICMDFVLPQLAMTLKISGIANSPMTSGMKLRPAIRLTLSNVNRPVPKTRSMPTVAMSKPRQAERSPLMRESPARPATMVSEKQISEKNSGGPKRKAKLAMAPVKKIRAQLETMSAKQEA